MINRLKEVYGLCFDDSKKYIDYVFKHKYSLDNALYYEHNGKVVSELFFVEKKLKIRDMVLPCPYIVGVCTLPEYRNKGYASVLMNRCFELLKAKGYCLCALHPFKHSFYEKYGFVTYNKVKIHIPRYDGASDYALKDIKSEDMPIVKRIYEKFMEAYGGYAVRNLSATSARYNEFSAAGECKFICKGNDILGYVYYDQKFAEEYCAPAELLNKIKQLEGKRVYIPYNSAAGETEDFTMLKLLDRNKLVYEYNIRFLEELDDFNFIHALTGSWHDFNVSLPDNIKQYYGKIDNFVFDKY